MKRIAWIILGLMFLLTTSRAASFDCGKALTKVEKLICGDTELSKLDESLNKAYQQSLERDLSPMKLNCATILFFSNRSSHSSKTS